MKYSWNKYAVIIAIPAVIIMTYLAFLRIMTIKDISNEPTEVCSATLPGNVWLISYAGGDDVHFKNQRYLIHSAINKCIDSYRSYTAKDIDPSYKKAHAAILSQSRGAGYWLWKPYFIMKTLKEIPENDIVLYVDSGAFLIKPIDHLVSHLTDHDIVLFKGHSSWTNKQFIKRDLLKMMESDNENIRSKVQVQASYMLIKNTPFSRNFVQKWLNICEDEKAITDMPSTDEHPEFIDHRHDQSILTLLYEQNPNRIYKASFDEVNEYFWHHRRRQSGTDISLPKQQYFKKISRAWKEFRESCYAIFRKKID